MGCFSFVVGRGCVIYINGVVDVASDGESGVFYALSRIKIPDVNPIP